MRIRRALTLAVAGVLLGHASPSRADDGATSGLQEETPASDHTVLIAVDFDAIPVGVVPPAPTDADVPKADVAEPLAAGIALEKMKLPPPRKKSKSLAPNSATPSGLVAKRNALELVELRPDHAELGAMYQPAADGTDFAGDSVSRIPCRRNVQAAATPVRWETATIEGEGRAQVEIKDLWFFSQTCAVREGAVARVAFEAVAWDGARPWLYASRDDRSVTFLMPSAGDVTADASVGVPVTVRGGFTRVSLPLGRWGSSSFVAHLASMALDVPKPPPDPPRRGQASRMPESAPSPAEAAVEVGVEIVQTMSERAPTVLVRRVVHVEPVARQPDRR
jgi:hypothetical protein